MLFNVELIEASSRGFGYDDLQFFELEKSEPLNFDSDDPRAQILFSEVPVGGALLYDSISGEYEVFTAEELDLGVSSITLGTVDFRVSHPDKDMKAEFKHSSIIEEAEVSLGSDWKESIRNSDDVDLSRTNGIKL